MLDELNYTVTDNGKILKEVCHYSFVENPKSELLAIQAQLSDLLSGQADNPSADAAEVIANYQEQVKILEGLIS